MLRLGGRLGARSARGLPLAVHPDEERRGSALKTGNCRIVRAVGLLGARGIEVDEGRAENGGDKGNSRENFAKPRLRFRRHAGEYPTCEIVIRCGANVY